MAYEELFTDLLKAEREEDVTDALTVIGTTVVMSMRIPKESRRSETFTKSHQQSWGFGCSNKLIKAALKKKNEGRLVTRLGGFCSHWLIRSGASSQN